MNMYENTKCHAVVPGTPSDHRHGSVLVLVVTVLLLIVLMGTAYMQVARIDRQVAIADPPDPPQDIFLTIAEILQDDLILTSAGGFFSPNDGVEPYDYPWTDDTVTTVWEVIDPLDTTSALGFAQGNFNDDAWLASISLESGPLWPHITNLFGYYLDFESTTGTFTPNAIGLPTPFLSTAADSTDVAPTANIMADADGDGIADSKWVYAPGNPVSNGVVYLVAVRIVDNSAMVNANVATAVSNADDAFDATHAPRWWAPTDLNLTGWARLAGTWQGLEDDYSGTTSAPGELFTGLLATRIGGVAPFTGAATVWSTAAALGDDTAERFLHWQLGPSRWMNYDLAPYDFATPSVADDPVSVGPSGSGSAPNFFPEIQLRYHNGLNNELATTPLETEMPQMLRSTGVEATSDYNAIAGNMLDYFDSNPRIYTTVFSGSAPTFAPLNNLASTGLEIEPRMPMRADINNDFAQTIAAILEPAIPAAAPSPPNVGSPTEYADQLAASLKDYADLDNKFTRVGNFYGLERLPVITEVYAERVYDGTVNTADADGDGLDDTDWSAPAAASYAIELYNPFNRPIDFSDPTTRPVIDLVIGSGRVTDIFANATSPALTALAAGETVLIYVDNGSPTIATATGTADYVLDLTSTGQAIAWPNSATKTADVDIVLEGETLEDEVAGTLGRVGYSKFVLTGLADDELLQSSDSPVTIPAASTIVVKMGSRGNGTRLDHLTYQATNAHMVVEDNRRTGVPVTPVTTQLGTTTKTGSTVGGTSLSAATVLEERIWIRDEYVPHAGEIFMVAMLGPSTTQTIGDRWGMATSVDDFRVDADKTTGVRADNLSSTAIPNYHVPWWYLLLDRVTTLNPQVDGIDNDNFDGNDNEEEQLVYGKINLNTIREDILNAILPIPDGTVRSDVVTEIVAKRDATPNPGIAFIAELWQAGNVGTADQSLVGGVPVDFVLNNNGDIDVDTVSDSNPATTTDDAGFDVQDKSLVVRWLSQVASVRSDTFTAYVLIHGYDVKDVSPTGLVVEERHIVTYDRSRVTDNSDLQVVFPGSTIVP